jgi:hypothetical protein
MENKVIQDAERCYSRFLHGTTLHDIGAHFMAVINEAKNLQEQVTKLRADQERLFALIEKL